MKNYIKATLAALFALAACTGAYGQKFARIDYQNIISTMPEMDSVNSKYQAAAKDYSDLLENIQVELNKKNYDYQKGSATMSDAVKQLKQKEIQDLNSRMQEFYQTAQQELAKVEDSLIQPLENRAKESIKKYCKTNGVIVVFQNDQVVYMDADQVKDITAIVKKELGCSDKPKFDLNNQQ